MATKKTSNIFIATIHGLIYGMPFVILLNLNYFSELPSISSLVSNGIPQTIFDNFNYLALLIPATHIIIDRYRLAVYWIKLVNWNWKSTNFGYEDGTPMWLSMWLMIIVDNTFHIIINSIVIYIIVN